MSGAKKVLIDTDPGMDDTLAMVLAAKSKAIELLGISSVAGNYPIEITTKNALKTGIMRDDRDIIRSGTNIHLDHV